MNSSADADTSSAEAMPLLGSGPGVAIPGSKKARDLVASDHRLEVRTLYVVVISAVLWLSVGVSYLMTIGNFEFIEALYISVQLITTVGYGDFTVKPHMQIFMAFYLLGCIIWVAFAVSLFADALQDASSEFLRQKMRVVERRMGFVENEAQASHFFGRFNDLIVSTFFFVVMLTIGTVFWRLMEPCLCLDAINQPIAGCEMGLRCAATGGRVSTWKSSFYLSVVTLTTCGFGDLHPGTKTGMAFACVWITIGVTATVNFIRAFTYYFFVAWRKHYVLTEKVIGNVFDEIDAMDGTRDGRISRNDYKLYLIKRFKLVDQRILDAMDKQFDLFEKHSHKTGMVSYKTMEEIYMEEDEDTPHMRSGSIAA
eukprot:TRINITY_DN40797_c0_g1_i1.p1 TRINITY_DN40797_c0_g1~~TRINITY_DN40797_c0_g1_i1.p1  ORF type:complete len:368 (+),score=41.87 TRINITY_DN40797_c0_g1_i1:59-1162(+)